MKLNAKPITMKWLMNEKGVEDLKIRITGDTEKKNREDE